MSAPHGMKLEPQNVLIDALLDQVEGGQVRVPQFQRPFVWSPERMLELFDSIEKSYPIGSLLLWQTQEAVPSLEHIGDIPVPPAPSGEPVSYVLDGHQRISTLFGVLRRPRDTRGSAEQRHWRWWVYRLLGDHARERYRHYRSSGAAPPHYFPLRMVSRTLDFLEFSRGLETRPPKGREPVEDLIRQAEILAHKIKNYQLTLIRLVGGTLDEAVEVYTRLNRTGVRMDPDQMVSALTYRQPSQPSLAQRIDELLEGVAETGFGAPPRQSVFRTVLAVSGESDVMSPSWEAVATRLAHRLSRAVPDADRAIHAAVAFLRCDVGLPLARFLPYAQQLMLLAAFFHLCPEPAEDQRRALVRWFWTTSWTNRFAGASYTQIRDALARMRTFAAGDGDLETDASRVRPVPYSFNLNSARTLAYVTWELREFPDRLDAAGNSFDVMKMLASGDTAAFRRVVDKDPRPANRVVLPTPPGMPAREALTQIWAPDTSEVLASHGIPLSAWHRLCEGDGEGFLRIRAEHIAERLRRFIDDQGITAEVDLVGGSYDDAENG